MEFLGSPFPGIRHPGEHWQSAKLFAKMLVTRLGSGDFPQAAPPVARTNDQHVLAPKLRHMHQALTAWQHEVDS